MYKPCIATVVYNGNIKDRKWIIQPKLQLIIVGYRVCRRAKLTNVVLVTDIKNYYSNNKFKTYEYSW
jgi:bisphosphoglycerate-independent phosphoglycerate mutase (AlkP superfamily)